MLWLDIGDLAWLNRRFSDVLKEFPEAKREMFERMGESILAAVRENIGGEGNVQDWQGSFVGSYWGYVAVRPRADTYVSKKAYDTTKKRYQEGDGRYAVGYVTNAIEHGHVQQKGRYVPAVGKRLVSGAVAGRHFYALSKPAAERIAKAEVSRLVKELEEKLKGG